MARGASGSSASRVLDHPVAGVAAAHPGGLHPPGGGQVGGAEAHALHAGAGGGDLLDVGHAQGRLEDGVDEDRAGRARPGPPAGPAGGPRSGCPRRPPPSGSSPRRACGRSRPRSALRSSSTQGDSRLLTRVHSWVSPRSISLPTRMSPSRAATLRSTGTASSRLPSRMSALGASSGPWPPSSRWRSRGSGSSATGRNSISRGGSGAPTASGLKKSRGFRTRINGIPGVRVSPKGQVGVETVGRRRELETARGRTRSRRHRPVPHRAARTVPPRSSTKHTRRERTSVGRQSPSSGSRRLPRPHPLERHRGSEGMRSAEKPTSSRRPGLRTVIPQARRRLAHPGVTVEQHGAEPAGGGESEFGLERSPAHVADQRSPPRPVLSGIAEPLGLP